ncbi:hypothetical protein K503DRAFT_553043 [Rhizopogon vinicolor AM-OR11-026]|uniref:Uncharacterized protein n=1 Tax=Rhizopogon vinicolor AM-OR11-026 TaxID=1314800 RepID=A0A1B7MKG8_9AGAM|nr:hypothetical protein K503DRAFT_553043 [Rhizopogon vinicolor AM-OR11-026]
MLSNTTPAFHIDRPEFIILFHLPTLFSCGAGKQRGPAYFSACSGETPTVYAVVGRGGLPRTSLFAT